MNKEEEKYTTRKLSVIADERSKKNEYENFDIDLHEYLTYLQHNLFFEDLNLLITKVQQNLDCLKTLQNLLIKYNCQKIDYKKLNKDLVDFSNLLTTHVENCLQQISKGKEERYEDSSNG